MNCEVHTEARNGILFVRIKGLLDYSTIDQVQVEIPEPISKVIIDFSGLEFIDSTGISSVLTILHECAERGIWLQFEGLNEAAAEVFDTIGVFKIRDALLKEGGS